MSYDTGSIMMIVGVLKDTLKKLKKAEERMAIKDDARVGALAQKCQGRKQSPNIKVRGTGGGRGGRRHHGGTPDSCGPETALADWKLLWPRWHRCGSPQQ